MQQKIWLSYRNIKGRNFGKNGLDFISDLFTERIPEVKLRDDDYGLSEGEIVRTSWKIVPEESKYFVLSRGGTRNMLDGILGVFGRARLGLFEV
ncbi:MAG: hypothetical protein V8S95_06205 [Odoribacter sp.]